MSEVARRFLGVGISVYENPALPALPQAVTDVETLAGYLALQRGFQTETVADPSEDEAGGTLKKQLKKDSLARGSVLVLLWSGHGELLPEGGLHLMATDTEPGSAPELTTSHLASYLARCGATQILLLLDTCFSGRGVLEAQRVVDLVQIERPPASSGSACWRPAETSSGRAMVCSSHV